MKLFTDLVLAGFDASTPYGRIDAGVLVIEDGAIIFSGARSDLPDRYDELTPISLGGRLVTPGLIDCHTHLVYSGSRAVSSSCASRAPAMRTSPRRAAASPPLWRPRERPVKRR
jgi:imidazolonepropionase-like amidohydrolase